MSYTPGFEGPHPSQLPIATDDDEPCGHSGLMDRWHGDDTTGPGHVWSCLRQCGVQVFYPDGPEPDANGTPTFETPAMPITFDNELFARLRLFYDEHRAKYKPLEEFKVTQEQFDKLCALVPPSDEPPPPTAFLFGIPVRLVETFEESTVYEQWRERFIQEMQDRMIFEPQFFDLTAGTYAPFLPKQTPRPFSNEPQ